jgi:hypothetical protein
MSEPTINTDGITDEQRKTEKFKSAYRDMLENLTAPEFIPTLCAHEAGHMIYFNQLGVMNFEPYPPTLKYDPTIDDYMGHLAAIQPLNIPTYKPGEFTKWLYQIADAHAAGGVIARKLMPSSDGGDQDDKERFKKLCEAFNKDPNINGSLDFNTLWKSAQERVAADIENSKNMDTINQEALRLRLLFGF